MANVLLTEKCVRSCPYCFAKRKKDIGEGRDFLLWEDLIFIADLIVADQKNHISLLGGEPSLHPHFIDFLIYLLERNFIVTVFTSGIWKAQTLKDSGAALSESDCEQLHFVCNMNEPERSPFSENESLEHFLELFGRRVVPGFNIYRKDFSLDFIFQHINRFGLQRGIRLGLAHPTAGADNACISIGEMDETISRLASYFPVMERLHIRPRLDCGYPLCKFSDEHLGWFYRFGSRDICFECNPVVDIGPDMSVWSCFPMSRHHRKCAYEFDSIREIYEYYDKIHHAIRAEVGGILEECDECRFRAEGLCSGGCISHLVNAFQNEAPVRMPEVYA
ncbi:MAG: radical SAM protein [Vulcanimicrobiota bacterium]